jgi:hypothetical protein
MSSLVLHRPTLNLDNSYTIFPMGTVGETHAPRNASVQTKTLLLSYLFISLILARPRRYPLILSSKSQEDSRSS